MRLTNSLRRDIKHNIAKDVMKHREEALKKVEGMLADAVYKESFDKAVVTVVTKLPLEWQTRATSIGVTLVSDTGSTKRKSFEFAHGDTKVIPNNNKSYNDFLTLKETHALAVRIQEYLDDKTKFTVDESELLAKVDSFLMGFTTVEKFVLAAPEWESHVPFELASKTANLPAVQIASLHSFIAQVSK